MIRVDAAIVGELKNEDLAGKVYFALVLKLTRCVPNAKLPFVKDTFTVFGGYTIEVRNKTRNEVLCVLNSKLNTHNSPTTISELHIPLTSDTLLSASSSYSSSSDSASSPTVPPRNTSNGNSETTTTTTTTNSRAKREQGRIDFKLV